MPDPEGNSETQLIARTANRSHLRSAADYLHRHKGRVAGLVAHSDQLVRVNRLLRAYLPPHLQDHARIVVLSAQVWIIQTESSAWAARLRYLLPTLKQQLGAELKQPVPALKLRIEPLREPHATTPPRRLTLTRENAQLLEGAAAGVKDERLGAALRRLAQHAASRCE